MMISANNVSRHWTPGVHIEFASPDKIAEFRTGIPAFVGFGELTDQAVGKIKEKWCRITSSQQFEQSIKQTVTSGFLRYAVRGFFENGGECCVMVPVSEREATVEALLEPFLDTSTVVQTPGRSFTGMQGILEDIENIDLICVPDLMMEKNTYASPESVIEAQQLILQHCKKMGDRFAILDTFPLSVATKQSYDHKTVLKEVIDHRYRISGSEGAVYFPWIYIHQGAEMFVPPCGHVAGIYARTDAKIGVFKAPANEIVEGALDLEMPLTYNDQADLNDAGVNCFRSSLGRGIRVWGARTLSVHEYDQFVSTRRLFLTLIRWLERNMSDLVFETYDSSIWDRVKHRLEGYCYELFQKGALKGQSPEEAYFVKCDRELNGTEVRELGKVISEVGLAAAVPAEFIVVRITQSATGITTTTLSLNQ